MANRIQLAWQALMGTLPEPREIVRNVPVFGEPHSVKLYVVSLPDESGGTMQYYGGGIYYLKRIHKHYATCEQAYAANPGATATEVPAIRIGSDYFTGELTLVKIEPKTKRAKGAK